MIGVILGVLLLLLLVGLVVLQGMIEWGNFDLDKMFGKKANAVVAQAEKAAEKAADKKPASKKAPAKKGAASKKPAAKKTPAKGKGKK